MQANLRSNLKRILCRNEGIQLTFKMELFSHNKNTADNNPDIQSDFEKMLFPNVLDNKIYQSMDRAIREAVKSLNIMDILTNSSEGGGGKRHGAPGYAYIEAKLSEKNKIICQELRLLLDKIHSKENSKDFLFNGSALSYGEYTGYYVIGINRKKLTDSKVKEIFRQYISRLKSQVELN